MAQAPPKVGDTVSTGDTKRTILSIQDFPAGYQTMKLIAENAPGTCSGRHTHPGIETSYLIEGETTFTIDGKPPTIYKAGGQWTLDPNVVHNACNTGNVPGKTLVTYVMPKGAPIATSESTPEAAKAMLAKAVAAVKADRDTALAQMLKGENGFLDGDLYPFCTRLDGKTIAGPRAVPAGTDTRTLVDAKGRRFGDEIMAAAQKPDGEITEVKAYAFPKPGTLAPLFAKTSFVTKVGDMICGSGYYEAATN